MRRNVSMLAGLTGGLFLVVLLGGCTQRILDFTVISSKNVNIKVKESGKGQRVKGEDMATYFLFPLGNPQVKEAVDRAIETAGSGYDALIDGVIYSKFNVFLLFGTFGYQVEGTPIKTSELITKLQQEGVEVDQYLAEHVTFHSSATEKFRHERKSE